MIGREPWNKKSKVWRELARELQEDGHSHAEIAKILGVSHASIHRWLGKSPNWTPPRAQLERERVERMHWEGKTVRQIEYLTSVPRATIHDWIKQKMVLRSEHADLPHL